MFKFKKAMALAVVSSIVFSIAAVNSNASLIAKEEQLEGANVVLDEYCDDVATGETATSSVVVENIVSSVSNTAVEEKQVEEEKEPEHVTLNLNYSRLGIASKISTYLNVRNKPSKKGKIIGKMTKNAGCHVYYIKKGWAKIVSGKVKGFVEKSYLTFDEEAEKLAKKVGKDVVEIKTNSLNVRSLPTVDAPIYDVVDKGEEFTIRKDNLTLDYVKKIIKKEKISKEFISRAGGFEKIQASLNDFICINVDNECAFVSKEYVKKQYFLKRATKVKTIKANRSSGVSSSQASIAEYAKQFLGNRYVWGGSSLTHGTDCSGFTMSLYARYGHSLPHNAAAQAGVTRRVSSPKPGDLFFYSNGSRINHVAMYIGGGMVIHASNPSDGIKISNAYYRHPVKIGRVM